MSKKKKITRNREEFDFSKWTITDNIPEGGRLHVPASLIMQFFGEEIQKRFIKGGKYTLLQKQQEEEKQRKTNQKEDSDDSSPNQS